MPGWRARDRLVHSVRRRADDHAPRPVSRCADDHAPRRVSRRALLAWAAGSAWALAACASGPAAPASPAGSGAPAAEPTPATARPLERIRLVNVAQSAIFGPVWVAKDAGYFEKYGLD